MKQTSLPYALMFKDMPDVLEAFRYFLQDYQQEIIAQMQEKDEGSVVLSLFRLAQTNGKDFITTGMVTDYMNENFKKDISNQKVAALLKGLHLRTEKKRYQGRQQRYIKWESDLIVKLHRRYILDKEEFVDLFLNKAKLDMTDSEEANNLDLEV